MGSYCFVHHEKNATPAQWMSLSGIHEHMKHLIMIQTTRQYAYGSRHISLQSRSVRFIKLPMGFRQVYGGKAEYVIKALKDIATIELHNPIKLPKNELEPERTVHRVYLNISVYEKRANPLIGMLERATVHIGASAPFGIAKAALNAGLTVNQLKRDLGLLNRRIQVTLTADQQADSVMCIQRETVTFGDIADLMDEITHTEFKALEVRNFVEKMFRGGVSILSAFQ